MESVIAADGMRIAYQRSGDGPPLILVHGGLDDHTRWAPLLPALRERFTVYAVDRRGLGASGATEAAPHTIESEFDDIVAVVAASDGPVHLLGHSYGALCALEAALRTSALGKLVLYEPPIPIPPGAAISPPGALAKMEARLAAGDREGVVLTFAREIARVPEEEIAFLRAMPAWEGSIAAAHTIVHEVRAVEDYVFDRGRFRGMATPTLLLAGSESPPYLRAATEAVAAALPRARREVLAGQGHVAMDTAPELFVGEVVRFLTAA